MHIPYPLQSIPMVVFFQNGVLGRVQFICFKKWTFEYIKSGAFIQKTLKNGWSGVALQIC